MNPRIFRVVVAFLGGFILLSMLPVMPGMLRALQDLPIDLSAINQAGDLLLGTTALLCAALLLISVRRRRESSGHGFEKALAQQTDHHAMVQPSARMSYSASKAKPATQPAAETRSVSRPDSELQARIRQSAKKGERAPALARKHSLSVDAIRLAIGDPLPAPAVRRGRTFRPRQPSLPAAAPGRAGAAARTPYGALA